MRRRATHSGSPSQGHRATDARADDSPTRVRRTCELGVPCPGCQREYDVTLFEFGRTIWCTCGRRVGLEPRRRELRPGDGVALLADAMLGRLARWLRLLGLDCAWDPELDDEALVRRGVEEGRVVLTRDRRLPVEWRISDVHVLGSDDPLEQVREVLQRLHLAASVRLFTRCSECNAPLRPASPEQVAARVPARIASAQRDFRACPVCGRVYWEGSHTDRIRRVAERLLDAARRPRGDAVIPPEAE